MTFAYDDDAQLIQITRVTGQYQYDREYRTNDGPDMVMQLRSNSNSQWWVRYVHGPNSDQPLAMEVYAPSAPPVPGTGQVSAC